MHKKVRREGGPRRGHPAGSGGWADAAAAAARGHLGAAGRAAGAGRACRGGGGGERPGGRVGLGEGCEEGAVRELYEETGRLVAPQEILATWVGEAPSGRALAAVTFVGRTAGAGGGKYHGHPHARR